MLIGGLAADAAAIAVLVIPLARGGSVVTLLPLALMLFVASSAMLVAAVGLGKKADATERDI